MRERFVAPILFILGLTLYFSALQPVKFVLDDGDMMAQVRSIANAPIFTKSFFYGGGVYYRPVLILSYLVDLALWDLHPGIMHFVNILLHIANALLVYLVIRIFYQKPQNVLLSIPFLGALLFLIHPINTESTNWISGRSDLLAAFFVLIATYLLIQAINTMKLNLAWLATLFILLGSMSKEVAFFTFPAFILIALIYKQPICTIPIRVVLWWRLKIITPLILGGLTYYCLRSTSFSHVDKGVSIVIEKESYRAPVRVFQQIITDFGFYIKKLLIPQPLSLAIDQVNPYYVWVGFIAVFVFALVIIYNRDHLAAMILLLILTIFPALLNALLHIAWTPYAERYLYLPAAFFCIAVALPITINKRTIEKSQAFVLVLLTIFYLPTTIERNLLWATPLQLTRLSHLQSPQNPTAWTMYGVMLANQEYYDEARAEFKKILTIYPDDLFAHESLSGMELYVGDPETARASLHRFFDKEMRPNRKILEIMRECNQKRLKRGASKDTQEIINELIETYLMIHEFDHRQSHLLEVVELAVLNHDYEMAEAYIETIRNQTSDATPLTKKEKDRLKKLQREIDQSTEKI